MKKKIIAFLSKSGLAMLMLTTVSLTVFTACGGDDDEGGSAAGNPNAGQYEDSDGQKTYLTQVNNTKFGYDESGQLTTVMDYNDKYDVLYNPFRIVYNETDDGFTYTQTMENISINSFGAITKMTIKGYDKSESSTEEGSGTVNISYDNAGHMTKMQANSSGTYIEDGKKYKYQGSMTYELTWSGGKLTRLVCTGVEDGEKDVEDVTFEYGDNQYPNLQKQFSDSMWGGAIEDIEWLSYLGYFGKGADYLPTKYVQKDFYVDSEGTHDDGTYTATCSYTFNVNGTIATEKHNGSTIRYTYSSSPTSVASAGYSVKANAKTGKRPSIFSSFFKKSNTKRTAK